MTIRKDNETLKAHLPEEEKANAIRKVLRDKDTNFKIGERKTKPRILFHINKN